LSALPSFFSRPDFEGEFLPGYVAVITWILLYKSSAFLNLTSSSPLDLLSAVLFLVAGPAAGITLRQIHRSVIDGLHHFAGTAKSRESYQTFLVGYAKIRMLATADQKAELDDSEGLYDFGMSVGIAFLAFASWNIAHAELWLETAVLIIISLLLFLGSYIEFSDSYGPQANVLLTKYAKTEEAEMIRLEKKEERHSS
jgi:hypothetical protein